jgi:hypothetical protein
MTRNSRGRIELTREEAAAVNQFIFGTLLFERGAPLNGHGMHGLTGEQWWQSYQSWGRGGRAWYALNQGGTGQMAALCWYQHVHRPGSHEWRPAKIIPAFVAASLSALRCGGSDG